MSKVAAVFVIALLFCFSISYAARPEPVVFHDSTPMKTHQEGVEAQPAHMEEGCEGVGAEECLMRRTLAAHLDYIYTQNHKP